MRAHALVLSNDFASLLPMNPAAPVMRITPSLVAITNSLLREVEPAEQLTHVNWFSQDALGFQFVHAREQGRLVGRGNDAHPHVEFPIANLAEHDGAVT